MSVMKQILDHLGKTSFSEWRIEHKRLWIEYLETGELPFTARQLHTVIRDIVNKPENLPRGGKLLDLERKSKFTLKADKTAYRPEEALERYVVISNDDNFYIQVPVGGGNESIDIVIEDNEEFIEFIELKPMEQKVALAPGKG